MCTMQVHRMANSDTSYMKLHTLPSLSRRRCQSCAGAGVSRLPRFLDINRMSWGIFTKKGTRNLGYMGVQGRRCHVRAAAFTMSFPFKELATTAKCVSASSFVSILKFVNESQLFRQCAPSVAVIMFAMWGLEPLMRAVHRSVLHEEDSSWKDSQMRQISGSLVRPLLLWAGVIFVCRAFDPLVLSTAVSQAIKQRFLNFIRSLSTVLAFAQCALSLTHQLRKVMSEGQSTQDSRSLGAQFVNNAVYTAVWVAAVCLFMELLGFSTQRWLTAGGLGTVLITLAGREILTNFLSSIMIHATRPFILNEWIQTKIDGYEVSGTVEHVGWWSPTIVRGDDREAVHIPNHKFTVSVVRNLSQKSHWRIKTYFGISHLDVSKVPNIVADMRKVLAKHPQVEQRRLHRRVFFEHLNPESQAVMVLVSCFVKTPHFEEYLRVKEVILLDLLKVISHHQARLATPIRSVQRVQDDVEPRTSPFRDTNRQAESQGRPFLLVDATAVSSGVRESDQSGALKNGNLSSKESAVGVDVSDSVSTNEALESSTDSKVPGKHKPQLEGLDSMGLNSKDITLLGAAFEKPPAHIPVSSDDTSERGDKVGSKFATEPIPAKQDKVFSKASEQLLQAGPSNLDKGHSRSAESSSHLSEQNIEKDMSKAAIDLEAIPLKEENGLSPEKANAHDLQVSQKEENDVRLDARRSQAVFQGSPPKLDVDSELTTTNSPAAKGSLEENLVLGVALDGPKRTLPLDEVAPATEQKELVTSRNGNSSTTKERRDGTQSSGLNLPDCRER